MAVVAPDKFRGSLDAAAAAEAMSRGLRRAGFDEVRQVPLADGGEGTIDALVRARGGRVMTARVTGPLGDPVEAAYAVLRDGTAVVEMARASGLALVEGENDPLGATTRGTGELVVAAVRNGARRVIVGVGGSATADGGLGAVEALAWSLTGVEVVVACDVSTPFLDAARVYGPQKGATPAQVKLLTRRLERLADVYRSRTGADVSGLSGGAAAGGLAGGLAAIGAQLEPGFDVVAEATGLDRALRGAWLAVTGEGRLDEASFEGKVVGGVLAWAREAGVPRRAAVVGRAVDHAERLLPPDVLALSLIDRAADVEDALSRAAELVEEATAEAGRWALSATPDG